MGAGNLLFRLATGGRKSCRVPASGALSQKSWPVAAPSNQIMSRAFRSVLQVLPQRVPNPFPPAVPFQPTRPTTRCCSIMPADKKPFARLPDNVAPRHYRILLKPDLESLTFSGSVTVTLTVKGPGPVHSLVCNAADLTDFFDVRVNGATVDAAKVVLNEDEETVTFNLNSPLEPGSEATLSCSFAGTINGQMRGFYRSKYSPGQGLPDRWAAVTQFESTEARRCFPCWDEPALKATFDLEVEAPSDLTVLSNTQPRSEEPLPDTAGMKRVVFETTPVMSTYLLALAVGEFDYVEERSRDGGRVRIRTYTPKGKAEQGLFSLKTNVNGLAFFEEFFGIPYSLSKYDSLAVADFQCGAMENWGLVTFRESCILVDPTNTSSNTKQTVALIVNHEMAHMWFGNLVTMEWWTHLWLKEGFASFMENTCTHALYPEYDIWTQFVENTLIPALELDALDNSHPIEVEVGHPTEVDDIFDDISYNKGASVIRMVHDYVGDANFRKGLNAYLVKFEYKNAVTEDLWAALEEASGKPVAKVMSTWTSQMGFPVIKVKRDPANPLTLLVSQEKFSSGPDPKVDNKDNFSWIVPIKVFRSSCGSSDDEFLLDKKSGSIVLSGNELGLDEVYKLNPGFVGYYRVAYEDPHDRDLLLKSIRNQSLSELDRLGLMDDLFALIRAGKANPVDGIKMLEAFRDLEESFVVWNAICNQLNNLKVILQDDLQSYEKLFKPFVVHLLLPIAGKLGWEAKPGEEDHTKGLLRSQVLSRIGCFGHEPTRERARTLFAKHLEAVRTQADCGQIHADLRSTVYRIVASDGDMETFHQLVELFKRTDLNEEQNRLSSALGMFSDPAILQATLEFAMSGDVRSQDSPFIIRAVAHNSKGRDMAWNFVKDKYDRFLSLYRSGMLLAGLYKRTTEDFATVERAKEVKAFFDANPNPMERTMKQAVESILVNSAWASRDRDAIFEHLSARASDY